jgi:CheY-like chemotaxis protein
MARRVLIVEHHLHTSMVLYDIFLTAGYECLLASDGGRGLEVFRRSQPDLIVTGVEMPVMSGAELLQQMRREDPDAAVIVLTGDRGGKAVSCLKLGAFKVLSKPVHVEELLIAADRALERRQLLIERRQHFQTFHQPERPAAPRHLSDDAGGARLGAAGPPASRSNAEPIAPPGIISRKSGGHARAQEWLSVAENHLSAAALRYRHCDPEGAARALAAALKAINAARSIDEQLDVVVAMEM